MARGHMSHLGCETRRPNTSFDAASAYRDTFKLRIMIAGQDPVQRLGVRHLFEDEQVFEVIAEIASPRDVLNQIKNLKPHVVVVGVPALSVDTRRFLKAAAGLTRVIVLTYSFNPSAIQEVKNLGVVGCLVHGTFTVVDLLHLVMTTGRSDQHLPQIGASSFPDEEADRAGRNGLLRGRLSEREAQVMEKIAEAMGNAEIADFLGVTEKTVKNHVNHIFAKLEVTSRAQAIVLWLRAKEAASWSASPQADRPSARDAGRSRRRTTSQQPNPCASVLRSAD